MTAPQRIAVVGAGNLGRALANYTGLAERGFPIRLLLDNDPAKAGTAVSGTSNTSRRYATYDGS